MNHEELELGEIYYCSLPGIGPFLSKILEFEHQNTSDVYCKWLDLFSPHEFAATGVDIEAFERVATDEEKKLFLLTWLK